MTVFYKLTSEEPKFPQDNLTLKALAKFYADLLFDFDHQDITFREDAIALGELLIHLGVDPVVVKEHWLGHHPMKQALVPPFNIPYKYETIDGGIKWDVMLDDLETGLINLGVKISNEDAIAILDTIEPLCQDETELLKISERVKKLLYPKDFQNWQNTIKPFQQRLTRRIWDEKKEKPKKNPDNLKLEIQVYLKESDPFIKVHLKGQICSSYRIKGTEFDALCKILESQNSTPQKTTFNFTEFMSTSSEAIDWIIPGFLPRAETILLAAQAKVGKTLTAWDIAYAVIAGDRIFGEQVNGKGKVLIVTSDESPNSSRRRFKARGFDLCPEATDNLRIMTHLDLNNLIPLESELEDFRPDLVIIDSLTSITRESGLSEKDAEFVRPIYRLKDLLGRYGAAGILIHHESKNKEAKSIDKVSGSARIVAATWGIWQLVAANPDDEKSPTRWLKIKPREGQASTHILEINPKDSWANQGIFTYIGEFGDENGAKKTQGERVIELLNTYNGRGLTYKEIDETLQIGRNLYRVLDGLESKQIISKRRSQHNQKQWVYATLSTIDLECENPGDSPPLTLSLGDDSEEVKTLDTQALEDIHIRFTYDSHTIHIPQKINEDVNSPNPCLESVSPNDSDIHIPPVLEGGRGCDDSSENQTVLMEMEEKKLESCDRTLKAGSIVTCEKYPGEILVIGEISGTQAHCCTTFGDKWIALSDLALSV